MAYDSDKEQLDELKEWWKQNGRVVVLGLVLGLGGVFGFKAWQNYTTKQAEQASQIYEQMVNWASSRNYARVDELAETLLRDHPKSGYAPMGALIRAHSAVAQDKPDEAQGFLTWVIDNSDRAYLRDVATLRLARLAAEKEDYSKALALLDGTQPGELSPLYDELTADILVAQDKPRDALERYRSALETERVSGSSRARIELKISDLGLGPEANNLGE